MEQGSPQRHAEPASAVVLAGGVSARLGHDKRRLRLWGLEGPTLLEQTIAIVGALSPDLVVVLNDPEAWPALPARLVADAHPGAGALGGIASGLAAARHPYALVVACDMPLLSPPLLAAMLARPRDYDALVPRSPHPGAARNRRDLEPLHAVYARACLGPLRAALDAGQRQIAAALGALHMAYVELDEIALHDPAGHSFLNINTAEQLAHVERVLRSSSGPVQPGRQ